MKLHEELYFEITVDGGAEDVSKFLSFVTSGELDEFFEFTSDFIIKNDDYSESSAAKVSYTLANDDYGIEIESLNPEDFLDVLCSGGKNVSLHGHLYDIDDEEYCFVSEIGSTSYINTENMEFNDELDLEASREEYEENESDSDY